MHMPRSLIIQFVFAVCSYGFTTKPLTILVARTGQYTPGTTEYVSNFLIFIESKDPIWQPFTLDSFISARLNRCSMYLQLANASVCPNSPLTLIRGTRYTFIRSFGTSANFFLRSGIDLTANVTSAFNLRAVDGIVTAVSYLSSSTTNVTWDVHMNESRSLYWCRSSVACTPIYFVDAACANNTCSNGGTCELDQRRNIYTCLCLPGYEGVDCSVFPDPCLSSPCLEGTSCSSEGDRSSYYCSTYVLNPCISGPCLNGGTCLASDNNSSFSCQCLREYKQPNCSLISIDIGIAIGGPLDSMPFIAKIDADYNSMLDALSVGIQVGFESLGPDILNGSNCSVVYTDSNLWTEQDVRMCNGSVTITLVRGAVYGFISAYQGAVTLRTTPNFTSSDLELSELLGPPDGIVPYERFDSTDGGWLLSSGVTGFMGTYINTWVQYKPLPSENRQLYMCMTMFMCVPIILQDSACASSPCANGGSCAFYINGTYTCECPDGFNGLACGVNIDDCQSDPCTNGATCIDGITSYHCACATGYSGLLCDVNVDECQSGPCLNSGTCLDGIASYECVCGAGFTGATCSTNINDCASFPCANGGTCVDGLESFSCSCVIGYSGDSCQTS